MLIPRKQLNLNGDRWMHDNAIDGRYIWLSVNFQDGKIVFKLDGSMGSELF